MKSQIEERTGEEVIAAGQLKQGRTPSMAAMVTGAALFEVLRPRRSKSLPKGFALAVTANRGPNMDGEPETDELIALLGK